MIQWMALMTRIVGNEIIGVADCQYEFISRKDAKAQSYKER